MNVVNEVSLQGGRSVDVTVSYVAKRCEGMPLCPTGGTITVKCEHTRDHAWDFDGWPASALAEADPPTVRAIYTHLPWEFSQPDPGKGLYLLLSSDENDLFICCIGKPRTLVVGDGKIVHSYFTARWPG